MSNNIFTVYGEVPELVEKKTKEIVIPRNKIAKARHAVMI